MDILKQNEVHGVQKASIVDEMKKSYLDYAMSVIVSRALPDARDGLKPVHRRILYSMYEMGCHYNRAYKKSARIVGDVMGRFHPHGDQAIYDSLVRMAQDFSLRVPLVDGQGNFGSIDKDDPAAMRYTESRLERVSHFMLEDIDKNTVSFVPSYDGSEKEPSILPTRFPNLIVNGSEGIAVGMATSIPPHNLGEILNACLAYIDNNDISTEEILEIVPAPDFPTGALIIANSGMRQALATGRGSIKMRGRANIEQINLSKQRIIITEIPYQVVKSQLIETIADLVKDKKIEGISEIRDESNKIGIRVVIELKKDIDGNVILNQLYKFTQLQCNFSANILALNNGRPEVMNLLSIIKTFVAFREDIIAKRTTYLLNKAKDKAHVLIGLCVAVDFIDEVVAIIRSSENTAKARENLLARDWTANKVVNLIDLVGDKRNKIKSGDRFNFTEEQVKAILEMRLSKLTGLERDSIVKELEELSVEVKGYIEILTQRPVLIELMKNELIEVRDKFATPRKSEIVIDADDIDIEDLIPREDIIISYTLRGYIKRDSLSYYNAQRRGGKGKNAMKTSDDDAITNVFYASTHSFILFFSDKGRVYKLKGYKIPIGSANSKGRAIVNLLNLGADEKISNFLVMPENKDEWNNLNLIFATKNGLIRRSSIDEFENIPSNGKIAMGLEENDELIGVKLAQNEDHILLAAYQGQATRFAVNDLRVIKSRNSVGVNGMDLRHDDKVVSLCIIGIGERDIVTREAYLSIPLELRQVLPDISDEEFKQKLSEFGKETPLSMDVARKWAQNEEFLLTITENGYGKRTSTYEYRITSRGGKGVKNIEITEKNGNVVSSFVVHRTEDIILSSSSGKVIRCNVASISIVSRASQGVKIINLDKGETVISTEKVSGMEEQDDLLTEDSVLTLDSVLTVE